jgi:hypothetical protein
MIRILRGVLAHHDVAEVFGEVAGGRMTTPCLTASGSLAGKMRPMPLIYSIPQRFVRRGRRGKLGGAPGLLIGARGDREWRGLTGVIARVSVVLPEDEQNEDARRG